MNRRLRLLAVLGACAVACALWLSRPADAMFMRLDEPVPVDRLVANLDRYVQQHPDDAVGHYTLGRVHSLAYAKAAYGGEDPERVEVVPAEKRREAPAAGEPPQRRELPGFAPYHSIKAGQGYDRPPAVSARAAAHLAASLRHYGRAVELDRENALYALGQAWMLEQAGAYEHASAGAGADAGAGASPATRPTTLPATRPSWREQALAAYRRAFELKFAEDAALRSYLRAGDALISREAAEGVVRMLEPGDVTDAERAEVDRMRAAIARLERIPAAVTPIVFSLDGRPWERFIDHKARSGFDLAGDGMGRDWPWVHEGVGLLVWDPRQTGRIESGRQLFGSVTWWMFWETGYDALASLDDDRDGRLAGSELEGIAAWFDRDGDGASDAGEVVPLAELGVVALRVAAESHRAADVAAWQPRGIELADGRTLPTYDWRPTSRASSEPAARTALVAAP